MIAVHTVAVRIQSDPLNLNIYWRLPFDCVHRPFGFAICEVRYRLRGRKVTLAKHCSRTPDRRMKPGCRGDNVPLRHVESVINGRPYGPRQSSWQRIDLYD